MSKIPTDYNGYITVTDRPISKVGVFPYLGKSIGAPNPDRVYKVLRPLKELSNKETIESFKLVPLIDEHEMLGSEATPAEKKGVQGTLGENVYFKDNTLFGNLKVFSESLKNLIEGGKKELSLGYKCKYIFEEGEFNGEKYDAIQTEIRGNHIALVEEGRMGKEVSVIDSKECFDCAVITFDTNDIIPNKGINMEKEELLALLKEALAPIEERIAKIEAVESEEMKSEDEEKKAEDMETKSEGEDQDPKADEEKKAEDQEEGEVEKLKAEIATLKEKLASQSGQDAAIKKSVMAEIAKRDRLADSLSKHVGAFDHRDMDLEGVVKYGLDKLELKADEGMEMATLNGYLAGAKVEIKATGMDKKEIKVVGNPYSVFDK
jgi:hypothetical protein